MVSCSLVVILLLTDVPSWFVIIIPSAIPCLTLVLPIPTLTLRLHSLDEIAKRLPKVLCLLSPQTLNQLVGDIRRTLHLGQQVVTEEINRFLSSSL
jgi:hypothetical protein